MFDQENLAELTIIRALRTMDVAIPELASTLEARRAGVCNRSVLKDSIAAIRDGLARQLDSWQDCGGIRSDR